jgi:hypothetical protein
MYVLIRSSLSSELRVDVLDESGLCDQFACLVGGIQLLGVLGDEVVVDLGLLGIGVVLSIELGLKSGSVTLSNGKVLSSLLEFLFNGSEFGVLEKNLSLEISEFGVKLVNSLIEVLLLLILLSSDIVQ